MTVDLEKLQHILNNREIDQTHGTTPKIKSEEAQYNNRHYT
jgi:hypothetical protein